MDLKALWQQHGPKVLKAGGGLLATAVVAAASHWLLKEFSIARKVDLGGPVWSMQGPIEQTKAVGQQYCSGTWSFVPRYIALKRCEEVRLKEGVERLSICPPGGATSSAELAFSDALIGLQRIQELTPDSKCLRIEYEATVLAVYPGHDAVKVKLHSLDAPEQEVEEFFSGQGAAKQWLLRGDDQRVHCAPPDV
jgi:hypothetical protein